MDDPDHPESRGHPGVVRKKILCHSVSLLVVGCLTLVL
jgi:hypothetical protein